MEFLGVGGTEEVLEGLGWSDGMAWVAGGVEEGLVGFEEAGAEDGMLEVGDGFGETLEAVVGGVGTVTEALELGEDVPDVVTVLVSLLKFAKSTVVGPDLGKKKAV